MSQKICLLVAVLALSGFGSQSVNADEGLKKGLAKAQYMLRQANAEKVEIKNQLAKEKEAAEEAQKALENKEANLKQSNRRIAKLEQTIEVWKEEYQLLKERYRESQLNLAQMQRQLDFKKEQFGIQTSNFELCEQQNQKLVTMSFSLLDSYQNKSVGDALKQEDPFFGLKQVEIENLVQDYRHEIEDLSLEMNGYLVQKVEGQEPQEIN